jgi:transmembrane sensor
MSIAAESPAMLRAKDVREAAAAWLERRVSGAWSVEDQTALDEWLAASPSHMAAYLRVEAAWNRTYRLSILRKPAGESAQAERAWIFPFFAKIAAVAGVVAVIGIVGAHYLQRPQERIYSTPLGGRETVAFSDGTRIELNTNTRLRTRMTSDERTVWIEKGEAYFRVHHDAAHPFVVIAGNRRVTDIGTAFLVRRDTRRLEVAVMQGRVRFDAPSAQSASVTALLTPGDVATATAGTMIVTRKAHDALAHELGWREGMLILDDVALADAVEEFNRYNAHKLVVADPGAAQMHIGGTFRTSDVQLFARVVQDVLGLHVASRGNDTVISR